MPHIALNSAEPGIRGLLRYRPETARPLPAQGTATREFSAVFCGTARPLISLNRTSNSPRSDLEPR